LIKQGRVIGGKVTAAGIDVVDPITVGITIWSAA